MLAVVAFSPARDVKASRAERAREEPLVARLEPMELIVSAEDSPRPVA